MTNRIVLVGLALLAASAASAQESAQESAVDRLARSAGLVAPPAEPPDFVKASRSAAPTETIPAFAPPPEPRSKVKSAAELGAMDADLQRASGASGPRPARVRKGATPSR